MSLHSIEQFDMQNTLEGLRSNRQTQTLVDKSS